MSVPFTPTQLESNYMKTKDLEVLLGGELTDEMKAKLEPLQGKVNRDTLIYALRAIINGMGDHPGRPGLVGTPDRVIRAWEEMFDGYKTQIAPLFATFDDGAEGYDEMVVVKDIEFFSTCEHHLTPFFGKAHVGYIPNPENPRILGLSKMARLVDAFAHRLQVQERICTQVVSAMVEHLKPLGAACVIEAKHLCMGCRGAKKPDAFAVTSKLSGVFLEKPEVRAEFFNLIGVRRG